MDNMSPDQHASRKCRNPFCSPDFPSGDQARGTREIVTSRTSPRTLLHILLTDPLRRIYRLADSRSGKLESPAGRLFDPSAVGSMTTARPPLSLVHLSQHLLLMSGLLSSSLLSTLRRCSSIVKTLCSRREKWGHYPPAVLTRKSYWRLTAVDCINRIQLL